MGWIIGTLVGGTIGVLLVYLLLHWAIFKRIIADRFQSRIAAAIAAYPASSLLGAWGNEQDGIWNFTECFVVYAIPALVVLAIAFKTGKDERIKATAADAGLTFQ